MSESGEGVGLDEARAMTSRRVPIDSDGPSGVDAEAKLFFTSPLLSRPPGTIELNVL